LDPIHYQAAGGVVINDGQVLLLNRSHRDEIRLPKGHVEPGETVSEAALREVTEETGFLCLAIVADLGSQRVQFVDPYRKRSVVRDEHYFLMRLLEKRRVERQVHEHQFTPIWVPAADAAAQLTFDSEKEFANRAVRWLQENAILDPE
jgi:8-oxo-dGTP pyrophosphatase MutT (NUDIX family)